MENQLQTTSLLEIRDFLQAHHCVPAPWESPDSVVSRLYDSLGERQTDDVFWDELRGLIAHLEDSRFNASALVGSRVLGESTLECLIDDLRETLPQNGNGGNGVGGNGNGGGNMRKWLTRSVTAASLMGFMILGSAVGCGEEPENEESKKTDDYQLCPEAVYEGIDGRQGDIYCQLIDIIESANISRSIKNDMLECLPELDSAYREALLEAFQGMDADEIAAYLGETAQLCTSDDDTVITDDDDDTWSDDDTWWGDDDDH